MAGDVDTVITVQVRAGAVGRLRRLFVRRWPGMGFETDTPQQIAGLAIELASCASFRQP